MSKHFCNDCGSSLMYCACENNPLNAKERLYILSYYGYDGGRYQILRGKDIGGKDKWKAFVDSLLPDVTDTAIEREHSECNDGSIHKGWVGSDSFHEALLIKLEALGYERVNPVAANFIEVGIYLNDKASFHQVDENERFLKAHPEAEAKVFAHNMEVEKRLREYCAEPEAPSDEPPCGGTADTSDLESDAERREGANPSGETK